MEVHSAPEVREAYLEYIPPFDVAAIVRDLLRYVPGEYLRGLKYVVLLNASGFSRTDRRRKVRSRQNKFSAGASLGCYYLQRPGEPAHIHIHVDRIIRQESRLALTVSIFRDSLFAWTLYHEVGHHIHLGLRPQYREPEHVADSWAARLRSSLLLQKYHYLTQEEWQRVREVARKLEQRRRRQSRTSRLGVQPWKGGSD